MKLKSSTAIGTWLRLARDKLGISRKTLATAAGLSTSTLRNAETSRHKITRHTAALLLQEIAKRDAALANSAPDSLLDAVQPRAKRPSKARPAVFTELPPLAYLRLHPPAPAHGCCLSSTNKLPASSSARSRTCLPGASSPRRPTYPSYASFWSRNNSRRRP